MEPTLLGLVLDSSVLIAAPIQPITDATAEIIARIGAGQAAQGINLPLADLIIGAAALELGYGVATRNLRDFTAFPACTWCRFNNLPAALLPAGSVKSARRTEVLRRR